MPDDLSVFGDKLTAGEHEQLSTLLWELLAEQVGRYTMGDSSSVTLETAEELRQSLVFSIGRLFHGVEQGTLLRQSDGRALLRMAQTQLERETETGRALLRRVVENPPGAESRALRDTVNELNLFFRRYDVRFFAHQIPCAIDYQLMVPVSEQLLGIDYVNAYLRRLLTEQLALRAFPAASLTALLERVDPDYPENLMGLLEPVLTGALGKALLGLPMENLCFTDTGRVQLLARLRDRPKPEIRRLFVEAAQAVSDFAGFPDAVDRDYIRTAVETLEPRFREAVLHDDLRGLLAPAGARDEQPVRAFVDGPAMDNGRLRALIREMGVCRFAADKISMFRRNVRSLRDAVEVLGLCFWDTELDELFHALDRVSLTLLLQLARQKRKENQGWHSESGWETRLERYHQSHPTAFDADRL